MLLVICYSLSFTSIIHIIIIHNKSNYLGCFLMIVSHKSHVMDRKHPKARPKDEEEFFERVEVVFFFF